MGFVGRLRGRVAGALLGLGALACEGAVPECGNGRLEVGERCDDGNDRAGDGCDPLCRIENGQRLVGPGALIDFELEEFCPDDGAACGRAPPPICAGEPQDGVRMSGGLCVEHTQVRCRFYGDRALAVLPGIFPTVFEFDRAVTTAALFFAHSGQSYGLIRFFDEGGRDILAFQTVSNCDHAPPGPVFVRLPRPARRAEVFAIGGPVFVDDLLLDGR